MAVKAALGACKCKVTHGDIELEEYNKTALSDDDIANNYILLCKASAQSDVILDIPGFTNGFPIKTMPSKIESIDKIGSVAILKLKLPANQILNFMLVSILILSTKVKTVAIQ